MSISVIIPALNEQAVIASAIDRAWKAGADEVIVSDGGSDDDTLATACSCRCQMVSAPLGRASQMNAGAAIATGDTFLFLHADSWLAESGCDQICQIVSGNGMLWGGFQQRIEDPRILFRWIESGNAFRSRWQRLVYGDQGIFISRRLFEAVGGFPNLPLMEDFELSLRLSKRVCPVLLAGPIHVSARRWRKVGAIRQTLRNWKISAAYRCGVSPHLLMQWYDA